MSIKYTITNTLKGRLSLWYVASITLLFLLFIIVMSGFFWITLQNQIDHHIHIAVNEAHDIVQNYQGEERDNLIKNLVSAQGMTVVVLSPDGAPMLETNSPDVALVTEHQLQKILTSSALYESEPVHFTESDIRFAALPAQVLAGKGIVAVGYSTRVLYATFYKMLGIITGIVVLVIFPLTFIGYNLLKKQLQPLERIADQARTITSTSSLARRIRIGPATEELTTIQSALNTMLSRLENVFKNERTFFSDAAHTLKTPLAVIRSQVENSELSDQSQDQILQTIDTANDTIQDLLLLSTIGSKKQSLEQVSLSNLMMDLAELAETLGAEKNLTITTDIQKNLRTKVDKLLLQRALSNIVHNAVIYNKSHGSISLGLRQEQKKTIITIQDNGVGIQKKEQQNIFFRFYRGSNTTGKGSGLGLAISKAVIESFGGTISLSSSIKNGTTVIVEL